MKCKASDCYHPQYTILAAASWPVLTTWSTMLSIFQVNGRGLLVCILLAAVLFKHCCEHANFLCPPLKSLTGSSYSYFEGVSYKVMLLYAPCILLFRRRNQVMWNNAYWIPNNPKMTWYGYTKQLNTFIKISDTHLIHVLSFSHILPPHWSSSEEIKQVWMSYRAASLMMNEV